jgi:dTDP-4-amino-4,6-dideoxygalactose transaminase
MACRDRGRSPRPGASLDGVSTWGDVGCFSFFSNKNLSTGEGGMVVTNRSDIAEKVRVLRSHGMTSLTDRHSIMHIRMMSLILGIIIVSTKLFVTGLVFIS